MARRGVLTYTTPEEMQDKIDAYFAECEGEILRDNEGKPILDKFGHPNIIGAKPPTITGLALAIGFNSRQTLLNYQAKAGFKEVLIRAKSRVEAYTEERLFDKDGANGARFSLQFNFKGWREDKDDESKAPVVNIICDIPRTPPTEASTPETSGEAVSDNAD